MALDLDPEADDRAEAARRLRVAVASDLLQVMEESQLSGSRAVVARRLRAVMTAESVGDHRAVRAALFDLAGACLAWAASIDSRHPPEQTSRRRRRAAL